MLLLFLLCRCTLMIMWSPAIVDDGYDEDDDGDGDDEQ